MIPSSTRSISGTQRKATPVTVASVPPTARGVTLSFKKITARARANTGSVEVRVDATDNGAYLYATMDSQKPPNVTTQTERANNEASPRSRNGITQAVSRFEAMPKMKTPDVPASIRTNVAWIVSLLASSAALAATFEAHMHRTESNPKETPRRAVARFSPARVPCKTTAAPETT